MPPRVYIETTIVSYLAARPSRDIILAAHQQITDEWWHNSRAHFELYTAQPVLDEAAQGDTEAAGHRLEKLAPLQLLDITEEVSDLAERLIRDGPLPTKAAVDAVHIATATVHGMDYLLTWNCKHIANALMRNKMEAVIRSTGYEPPILCTPEELKEGQEDE